MVQANLDPLRQGGDLVANAGRSTRDFNLSHPASYTALTRTKLVPARRALAVAVLVLLRHDDGGSNPTLRDDVQLCDVAKVSFQLETSS